MISPLYLLGLCGRRSLTEVNEPRLTASDIAEGIGSTLKLGVDMKQSNLGPQQPRATRRIAGHAQQDHILDPYQAEQKLHEDTVCPQCGAVYHDGRWQWVAREGRSRAAVCRLPPDQRQISCRNRDAAR